MPGPNEKDQEEENTGREYERLVDQMYGRDDEQKKDDEKDKKE